VIRLTFLLGMFSDQVDIVKCELGIMEWGISISVLFGPPVLNIDRW
jgi:hypothetical protein